MRRSQKTSCGWPKRSCVKSDLCAKVSVLDRVHQEALKAGNCMERLTEELGKLWMDLARQEALASRRTK